MLLLCIIVLGLLFDYTNGFHDAANVVSTVIATRVLAPLTAIVLAALLNLIGATQVSGVAHTITSGLVAEGSASQLVILSALVGAIVWNLLTWYFGIPSSSSYALVGGLVGAAWLYAGERAILWDGLMYKVVVPMVASPLVGFLLGLSLMKALHRVAHNPKRAKLFSHLQIASASLVALSHGLNDAQKSMAVITLGLFASGWLVSPQIPFWVIAACALMMGLGTATGGFRIIRTVGFQITRLQPVQGFAAETSASCVILAASFLGMPVSSTHMIVGSITGVGAAKGMRHVAWGTGKKILLAWIFTLPGAALLSVLIFKAINYLSL